MVKKLNPWKIPTLTPEHYNFLKRMYNLKDVNFSLKDNPNFIKRNLLIGHDNFKRWINKAKKKKKVALISGFMTSGFLHLGSLTVLKQMAYYQKKYNADVIIPIADLEAMCVRKNKRILKKVITHKFKLEEFEKAVDVLLNTKHGKVMFQLSEE